MAASAVFDVTCDAITRHTSLGDALARGTLRLALTEGGLNAETVDVTQMKAVVSRLLSAELSAHGIDDVEGTCRRITEILEGTEFAPTSDRAGGAAQVLQRIGG